MDNESVGRNCYGLPSTRSIFSCNSSISREILLISRSCSLSKLKRIYIKERADTIIMVNAIVIEKIHSTTFVSVLAESKITVYPFFKLIYIFEFRMLFYSFASYNKNILVKIVSCGSIPLVVFV